MRRQILSLCLVALTTVSAWAARALSEPVTVRQPDGTELVITLHGDEHIAWLTTTDGTLLVERDNAYYVAAIGDDGVLTATDMLAHAGEARGDQERQTCQEQATRRHLFFDRADRTMQDKRRAQVTGTGYFPHQGSPRCLVILANFSNMTFTNQDPVAQFTQYFNGDTQVNLGQNEQNNLVSVRKYFEQSSRGAFTPQFDIVGPVTLPQTHDYYGTNTGEAGTDIRYGQFCKDVIDAVDDQVDFKNYVNGSGNRAELVCIIYAGYGESVTGNSALTIWPKCGHQGVGTDDGVTVSYVNCSPELFRLSKGTDINGIGLFCHEFSHGMGLPDLYPTDTSARINNQTPEFWDLMDYGEYASNGYAPVPYTAWEQEAMGWLTIEKLTESRQGIVATPLVKGGKAYKFGNGANAEEWMVVESVQPRDTEAGILGFRYGHGLLVTHLAYVGSTVNMTDYPNNTPGVPRVSIVPADGLVINGYKFGDGKEYTQQEYINSLYGDPFPGTTGITELNADLELPNYKFYNGDEKPAFRLTNITEDEETGAVTFDFDSGTTTVVAISDRRDTGDNAYYTLDGRRLQGQPRHSGLFIHQGRVYCK